MEWALYVLAGYIGFISVYTGNYQVVTIWLGTYLANLDEQERGSATFNWREMQDLMTPKSQTNRQFARLIILPVLVVGFIKSVQVGLICLGVFVGAMIITKLILPKGQKHYIDDLLKHLATRISHPKNKYDKKNKPALVHVQQLIEGYVENSDMKNYTLKGLKQFMKAGRG